jgi:hypothetical protein
MALTAKPKKPAHHRKRQAGHHRRSKRYVKTYWPYLPMLLIVASGVLIGNFWTRPQVLGDSSNFTNEALVMETNEVRAEHSQPSLNLSPTLSVAAQAKADDMVSKDYWAHTGPDGSTPWTFITAAGYTYQYAGENLAFGFRDVDQIISGWMNSPEHRANLLGAEYLDVGFGVASSPDFMGKGPQIVVVAEYAAPSNATAAIRFNVNQPQQQVLGQQEVAAKRVAAIQLFTDGRAAWSSILVAGLAGAAITVFALRHGYRLHRMMNRGEMFIAQHPWFDVMVVFVATACIVLYQTGGFIR